MVYGPIAAWLVELFPTRIRYTSMSLPYHIGNGWFGGFLPSDRVRDRRVHRQHLLGAVVSADRVPDDAVVGTFFLRETNGNEATD